VRDRTTRRLEELTERSEPAGIITATRRRPNHLTVARAIHGYAAPRILRVLRFDFRIAGVARKNELGVAPLARSHAGAISVSPTIVQFGDETAAELVDFSERVDPPPCVCLEGLPSCNAI
jgi:hypothetical protein